jgi:hypothetical protein
MVLLEMIKCTLPIQQSSNTYVCPCSCVHSSVAEHALYTVVNLMAGWERQKEAVMQSNLPAMLMHILRSPPQVVSSLSILDLRVPALWCIINLVVRISGD